MGFLTLGLRESVRAFAIWRGTPWSGAIQNSSLFWKGMLSASQPIWSAIQNSGHEKLWDLETVVIDPAAAALMLRSLRSLVSKVNFARFRGCEGLCVTLS